MKRRGLIVMLLVLFLIVFTPLATLSGGAAAAPKKPTSAEAPDKDSKKPGARPFKPMTWTGVLSEKEFARLHELSQDEVPELHGEMIPLVGGHAYLSLPEGAGPHPGIVVIQEWWGLNDNIKHWSDRLARLGYAAIAIDLYDGRVATTREDAYSYMSSLEDERAYEIMDAAFDFLGSDSRIQATKRACVGWCFGGGWSLNLALTEPDLDAAVVYYGHLTDDVDELSKIGARVCGIFGTLDKGIPPENVDAFEAALGEAGVDYEIHRYDAEHAFANPSSARYNHEAAGKAWKRVRKFLAASLK